MKKKNIIIGIVGSILMATSMVGSITASAASSKRISGVYQYPQETGYWCGYSALQSAINNEYRINNLESGYNHLWSQSDVANYVDGQYSSIDTSDAMPWYIGNKNVDTAQANYPAGRVLNNLTKSFSWLAYGTCTTGNGTLAASAVKSKVMFTTDRNHAVLSCGRSNPNGSSYMPGYPRSMICHWIASDGYKDNGNSIWVVDPAAKSSHVSGFTCDRYYSVSLQKFTDFSWYHGIIW